MTRVDSSNVRQPSLIDVLISVQNALAAHTDPASKSNPLKAPALVPTTAATGAEAIRAFTTPSKM